MNRAATGERGEGGRDVLSITLVEEEDEHVNVVLRDGENPSGLFPVDGQNGFFLFQRHCYMDVRMMNSFLVKKRFI